MKNYTQKARSIFSLIAKHKFILSVVAVYLVSTVSYIGPAFYQCNDSIYGFGDSTAGPIWKASLKPEQSILGGYENSTNYPQGETLYSPVGYVTLIQSTFSYLVSKVVGPVCSYNLYNILGYMSSSLLMFAFILYLTRSRWIALLAGYAVAFTPYVQAKIGGHPSYGYSSLLIAILWLTIHLITHRKILHASLLGVALAACAYLDPYFILFAITVMVPIGVVWLFMLVRSTVWKKLSWRKLFIDAKPFVIAILLFLVIVTPLLVIRVKDAALINSSVANVRGNVEAAAMLCSNKPLDYLLPDPYNIYLKSVFGEDYTAKNIALRNWCGSGESRVSISLVILGVIALGGIVMIWERLNRRKLKLRASLSYDPTLVIGSIVGIGLLALMLGLPPYIHDIITPTGIVLHITEMWRIFAREFLVVNIAAVVLFAIVLKYFSANFKRYRHALIIGVIYTLVVLGIIASYQINPPFNPPVFSYSRDVPQIYERIKNTPEIQTLAEYPIDRTGIEYDSIVYYLTMQAVHGKKLFNSAAITNKNAMIHYSLKDLADPQTIPTLRSYGIQYVVVHSVEQEDIKKYLSGVEVVAWNVPQAYSLTMVRPDKRTDIVLLKILEGPKVTNVLTLERGFNLNLELMRSPVGMEYEVSPTIEMSVRSIKEGEATSSNTCFDIRSVNAEASNVIVRVNGRDVETKEITGVYVPVELSVKTGDRITLHNPSNTNMAINNLGCRQ